MKKPDPASAPPVASLVVADSAVPGLFAGTSGWAYPTWKPGFYPATISAKRFLGFYATQMNSVEVNYTFRQLPTPQTIADWLAATGPDFRFSFKAPQAITHFKRLVACEDLVAEFLASLKPVAKSGRLGPILFQLPPNFKADPERLTNFLKTKAMRGKNAPQIAFEFRHESWFAPEMLAILKKFGAALCIAESDDLATPEAHTAAAFTCYRLRRNGGYTDAELAEFASRFVALATAGRTVYAYFKHEDEPTGALNGAALLRIAGGASH